MAVTIKYFGAIAEQTGVNEEKIALDKVQTVESLKAYCLSKHKSIADLSFQIALNQSLVTSGSLSDGDEVAFLPPFAGG